MNGPMMNYKKYLESLESMQEPKTPSVIADFRAELEYAKKKGVGVFELSKEEVAMFLKPLA